MSILRFAQHSLDSVWRQERESKVVNIQRPELRNPALWRPPLWRRALAALIDRMAPLPFLAYFFPRWTLVVLAYHLLCDCSPARRSVGKWVCRLRVVDASSRPCSVWQSALRRAGSALTQTAWALWQFIPLVMLYELAALACVLLDPQGRRPEDFLSSTKVVTEKRFRLNGGQR